ncbi:MAG: hypothetical protein Q7R39_19430 [Dehalococcoidia bacterium]|nr:hypothetical protein [Dehalococcoidia bacterium]
MNLQASPGEADPETPSNAMAAAARVLRAGRSPVRAAFAARALNALARLTGELDERSLGNAAGAPSDYATLLQALEDPAALTALRREDPLASARLRGLHSKERLLEAEGGVISAEDAAGLLHITRQAVDKRRRAGRLIGVNTGRHGYAYPMCQFAPQGGVLPGLGLVLGELHEHGPWMQLAFLLNQNTLLGGDTPLAELRLGHLESVVTAAHSYGEQGAD